MSWNLFDMEEPLPPQRTLRPYQTAAVTLGERALTQTGRCLLVGATGTGKTEIIAQLATNLLHAHKDGGVLVVSPLIDLVSQTAARLRSRGVECDIEQGSLRGDGHCTVASYQSLIRGERWRRYVGKTKLICVDEVHLNYTKRALHVLDQLVAGGAKIVGLTASPQRGSGDPLTKFYGQVAWNYPVVQATQDGWLVPSQLWLTVAKDWDLSQFASKIGDFDAHELDRLLRQEAACQFVAELVAQNYDNLPSVVFCHSIAQSEGVVKVLARDGIEAAVVHSKQQTSEREENLTAFESGQVKIICNVGVLSLGWDHAPVRNLFLCKPTKSQTKYLQMYGRGTRPLPGVVDGLATPEARRSAIASSAKPHFTIYDVTDTSRHCELQSALDVLCQDVRPELMKRVKKRLEGGEKAATKEEIDSLLEAESQAEAREQAALDALDEDRRLQLRARIDFGYYGRDSYAAAEAPERKPRRWHMLFGQHKGKPLGVVPTPYLWWVANKSNCRNQLFIAAVRNELRKRKGAPAS
jgi:superfamily II DNA or RNA helicase